MSINIYLLSIITGLLASITPGPSFLYVFNLSLLKENIYVPLIGMWFGSVLCGALALFGISFILITFHIALIVVKLLGAIVLIYMGLQKFISKTQQSNVNIRKKYFITGTLVTFSNPKILLYYAIILPQFIQTHSQILTNFSLLVITQLCLKAIALVIWFFACRFLSEKIIIDRYVVKLNLMFGVIFLIVGCTMAIITLINISKL